MDDLLLNNWFIGILLVAAICIVVIVHPSVIKSKANNYGGIPKKEDVIEPFFGEPDPAPFELVRSGLDVEGSFQSGISQFFDYSNRFIDAQFDASRIEIIDTSNYTGSICK